jgi:MFS family permease
MKNFFSLPNSDTLNPGVVKHFKRNFFANLMDSGFWFFGDSFVAAYTIMPVFMSTLTDSPILIGMIPALEGAGWFLPQLFLAKHLEGRSRRLPLVLKLGVFDRVPILFLAVCAFFILRLDRNVAVGLFLFFYLVKVFSNGLVALPWQELIATVIPVSHRGRYWGSALILGRSMGMIGAIISGVMLSNIEYPTNYAFMFLIGFVCAGISYFFLSLNKEPEIERQNSAEQASIWGRIRRILKSDRNFGIYLVNRVAVFLSFMGLGFVTVYGLDRFNLPISYSAIFTGVMLASEIVGYGIWGTIGDRDGYKRVIEISNLILIFGLIGLLLTNKVWGLYIVFGIISIAHSGEYIADQNIAMEFGKEEDRPTYIGMSKTLTGPVFLVAPIIGGGIVKLLGYQAMFLAALIVSFISFVIIKFFVTEPRHSISD